MRKITLLIVLFFISLQSNAQLADGSTAPDFTVTDINGNSHTLSEYLAAGKTVIIDISATWCAPCWNYHNNHTLDDLNSAYGVNGSDEVVVLFVEGDGLTTLDDLYGTGDNTRGNWVEGSTYPIIDSDEIADLYEITYFPTIYRICPSGIVSEIGAAGASAVRNGINNNCGVTLEGVQNHAGAVDNENSLCSTTGTPVAKLKNYGTNIITSATLNLKEDGAVVATKNFTGSVNQFITRLIPFDEMTVNPDAEYTFEVLNVNASPLYDASNNVGNMGIAVAEQTTSDITVNIFTDDYPTEISWKIKNSLGATVASGGPYVGSANGGGADANTTKTHAVTLPLGECFSFQLLDAYGDGWSYGNTPHGFEIVSAGETIYSHMVGDFGTSLTRTAIMSTTALGVDDNESTVFGIYPNPSTGIVRINTENPVQVTIVDILGKTVYKGANITSESQIDLSGLQKGMYLAKIAGDSKVSTEKIILN